MAVGRQRPSAPPPLARIAPSQGAKMRQFPLTKGQNGAKSAVGRCQDHDISMACPKTIRGRGAPRRSRRSRRERPRRRVPRGDAECGHGWPCPREGWAVSWNIYRTKVQRLSNKKSADHDGPSTRPLGRDGAKLARKRPRPPRFRAAPADLRAGIARKRLFRRQKGRAMGAKNAKGRQNAHDLPGMRSKMRGRNDPQASGDPVLLTREPGFDG